MCFQTGSGCILVRMRALVVMCLACACSNTGLMLDIHAAAKTKDVVSVEVFVPGDTKGDHMGLPMATKKTGGVVYITADHVTAEVATGTQILLQPGSIDSVPELLVLGYDKDHKAVQYADVYDPKGPIQLPHAHADTITVDLAPITEVSAAGAGDGSPANGPRLARWSQGMVDDPNGKCVALLEDDGRGAFKGVFFSPGDDLDCDGAKPECDDTWYLKVGTATTPPSNPLCVRDDRTSETMDACRVGDTVACTDNVGDCNVRTQLAICVPSAMCTRCNDQIDQSCFLDGITDDTTPYIQCDLPVGPGANNPGITTLCGTTAETMALDLSLKLGGTFTVVTSEFDQPPAVTGGGPDLPLAGATSTTLHVANTTGARGMTFTAENGTTPGIDSGLPDTQALLVIGVHGGVSRVLVLPFIAHYVADCSQPPMCRLVEGMQNGQTFNDPIWHCSGI